MMSVHGGRADHEEGATSVEYALMATLIAVMVVGGVTVFGEAVRAMFQLIPPSLWP